MITHHLEIVSVIAVCSAWASAVPPHLVASVAYHAGLSHARAAVMDREQLKCELRKELLQELRAELGLLSGVVPVEETGQDQHPVAVSKVPPASSHPAFFAQLRRLHASFGQDT